MREVIDEASAATCAETADDADDYSIWWCVWQPRLLLCQHTKHQNTIMFS